MRTWGTWWSAALVATAVAGCPDMHPPDDEAGVDARTSVDAGRDAGHDGGMDAARAIDDAGTHAPPDAGIDAHDAAVIGDTNADGALFCPTAGGCTLPSGAAGHCCGGVCSDWATDPTNCGACGGVCGRDLRCRQGRCEHPSCVGVVSSGTAASTAHLCPLADGSFGTCCDGACRSDADLRSDPANCGGCGRVCPDGTCGGGACGGVSPHCGSGSAATCPAGTSCQYYGAACERSTCAGASDGSVCSLPGGHDGVCCSGACVDAARDASNCGACGHVCPAGTACGGGCFALPPCGTPDRILTACVLPSGGIGSCCGNDCVDTTSDAMNCRLCAVACPTGSSCEGGGYFCATPQADGGIQQVHCTTSADCPEHFHCLPGLPTAYCGRDDCVGVPDGTSCGAEGVRVGICCGGACVDSWSDPNCGACGRACASGVCTIITYLGGGPVVTCLPDVTNTTDCGGAGGCPAGESCVGGVCVLQVCPDQGPLCVTASGAAGRCCVAGACTDVSTDPRNCGDCITQCRTGETCVRGRCVP